VQYGGVLPDERRHLLGVAMGWRPLLDGSERREALAVIHACAQAIWEQPRSRSDLNQGDAGWALFYAYLARAGFGDFSRAQQLLDGAIDAIASKPMTPDLYTGLSGIAWTAEHLYDEDDGGGANDIDTALVDLVSRKPWTAAYDLVGGLVGYGVYALERHGRGAGPGILEHLVARLGELATRLGDGLSWLTPPERTGFGTGQGCYNVGLAHGVPGIIAVLAECVRLGIAEADARRLLTGAVTWLLSLRGAAPDGSLFPAAVGTQDPEPPRLGTRAAWCYGDPGIAVALLAAARAVGRTDWEASAIDIGASAARRDAAASGVVEAGLCHGAGGLVLIYDRLWQATGDARFRDAALTYVQHTLAMRRPGEGVAGYLSLDSTQTWTADAGFLNGACGVALSLLAAATDVEPRWDRVLLTSLPPR
jgi:lantibiotic modifying enzyme